MTRPKLQWNDIFYFLVRLRLHVPSGTETAELNIDVLYSLTVKDIWPLGTPSIFFTCVRKELMKPHFQTYLAMDSVSYGQK